MNPGFVTKKLRVQPFPATQETSNDTDAITPSPLSSIGSEINRLIHHPTCLERTPAHPTSIYPDEPRPLPSLSSFRPHRTDTQGLPPATPRRSSMPQGLPSSPPESETPSYARSLHLIDTDISIYKATHGEAWLENSLCLKCFRRGGAFHRVLSHGYEVCGSEEVLKSHFWEDPWD